MLLLKLKAQEAHQGNSLIRHLLEPVVPQLIHQYLRFTLKNITRLHQAQVTITQVCKALRVTLNQDLEHPRQEDNCQTLIKDLIGRIRI